MTAALDLTPRKGIPTDWHPPARHPRRAKPATGRGDGRIRLVPYLVAVEFLSRTTPSKPTRMPLSFDEQLAKHTAKVEQNAARLHAKIVSLPGGADSWPDPYAEIDFDRRSRTNAWAATVGLPLQPVRFEWHTSGDVWYLAPVYDRPDLVAALTRVDEVMRGVFQPWVGTMTPHERANAAKARATAHGRLQQLKDRRLAQDTENAARKSERAAERILAELADERRCRAERLREMILDRKPLDAITRAANELADWFLSVGRAKPNLPARPLHMRRMPLPSFHPKWRDERDQIESGRERLYRLIRGDLNSHRTDDEFVHEVQAEVFAEVGTVVHIDLGKLATDERAPQAILDLIVRCCERIRARAKDEKGALKDAMDYPNPIEALIGGDVRDRSKGKPRQRSFVPREGALHHGLSSARSGR